MKLYLVGTVGTGKTTLANRIGERTGISVFHLDEVLHVKDGKTGKSGNRRRTEEEWKPIFEAALNSSDWILEDTGRLIFSEGLKRAEKIALLELPPLVIRFRLVRRYLRQKLSLESCAYRPSIWMLRNMFRWAKKYKTGKDELKERLALYSDKLTVLRNNKEINDFLCNL